jgi:hypothetical protein
MDGLPDKDQSTRTAEEAVNWACPGCHARLLSDAHQLVCTSCGAAYPRILGLPVLIRDPTTFIAATIRRSRSILKATRDRLKLINSIDDTRLLNESILRLRRTGTALLANSLAFQRLMRPIESWISEAAPALHLVEDSDETTPPYLGWDPSALIPFLLRDWTCDQELGTAAEFISSALHRHLSDARHRTLTMLGCGSGGLAGRLSREFSHTIGLDLSIPTLAAVRRLQEGGRLFLHYPVSTSAGADVKRIALRATSQALNRITFAAADAATTPLEAGSVDCVMTCFLLDVLDDPSAVGREIYRILSESGLWINYGPSNGMTAVWRFDERETAAFVRSLGFSLLETAHHRTTHLDLRPIDELTHFYSHVCYLSVAKKQ